MLDLKQGTTETLLIDVKDKLGNLTDLSTGAPKFSVFAEDRLWVPIANQDVIVDPAAPMTAKCVVHVDWDWTPGKYNLYISFTSSPDSPTLGPFEFKVNP